MSSTNYALASSLDRSIADARQVVSSQPDAVPMLTRVLDSDFAEQLGQIHGRRAFLDEAFKECEDKSFVDSLHLTFLVSALDTCMRLKSPQTPQEQEAASLVFQYRPRDFAAELGPFEQSLRDTLELAMKRPGLKSSLEKMLASQRVFVKVVDEVVDDKDDSWTGKLVPRKREIARMLSLPSTLVYNQTSPKQAGAGLEFALK